MNLEVYKFYNLYIGYVTYLEINMLKYKLNAMNILEKCFCGTVPDLQNKSPRNNFLTFSFYERIPFVFIFLSTEVSLKC